MKTGFMRVVLGLLTGWLLPPLVIALSVGVLMGVNAPQPGEGLFDPVLKGLVYGAIIGLSASLGVMVLLVSPTWFFLHRGRAGARGFLIAGGVIGAFLGLVPLAGPALAGNSGGALSVALTLAVPTIVGALTFLLIRWIAYGKGG
jgi:hypothetical protein